MPGGIVVPFIIDSWHTYLLTTTILLYSKGRGSCRSSNSGVPHAQAYKVFTLMITQLSFSHIFLYIYEIVLFCGCIHTHHKTMSISGVGRAICPPISQTTTSFYIQDNKARFTLHLVIPDSHTFYPSDIMRWIPIGGSSMVGKWRNCFHLFLMR